MTSASPTPEPADEVLLAGTKYEVVNRLQIIFWQAEHPAPSESHLDDECFSLRIIEEDEDSPESSLEPLEDAGYIEPARPQPQSATRPRTSLAETPQVDSGNQPPWTIGLTARFSKSALRLDKKLKGRILEAVLELCDAPDTPHGDTIKPLEGDRRGDWRYRIGDYRLIYRPNRIRREVLLLEVASRGGIYN